MTIVLTPYWSQGVQKLKLAPQRMPSLFFPHKWLPTRRAAPKSKHGLKPPVLDDSVHALRCLSQLRSKDKSIEKYIYLSALKEQDPDVFYKLCLQNMAEFTPIIYTPTVGDACLQYSHIYRRPEGMVRTNNLFHLRVAFKNPTLVYFYQRQGKNPRRYSRYSFQGQDLN